MSDRVRPSPGPFLPPPLPGQPKLPPPPPRHGQPWWLLPFSIPFGGWAFLFFVVFQAGTMAEAGDTCATLRPRDEYQDCVRSEELFWVGGGVLAFGIGVAAVLASARGILEKGRRLLFATSLTVGMLLLYPSLLLAFSGDSLHPERTAPYDTLPDGPIWVGVAISSLLGAVFGILAAWVGRRG